MESNVSSISAKWSLAARDGLILASVTVVVSTLSFLTRNPFLSSLLWIVKLGGSLWLLHVIMKQYGASHPSESTFGYGVLVCVLSALVCAVWTFVEYQFLFPGTVAETFEQLYANLDTMIASTPLPDNFSDLLYKMEDNFAQLNCIASFFWCTLLGLLFSAVFARGTRTGNGIFTPEEMQRHEDDDFNL